MGIVLEFFDVMGIVFTGVEPDKTWKNLLFGIGLIDDATARLCGICFGGHRNSVIMLYCCIELI